MVKEIDQKRGQNTNRGERERQSVVNTIDESVVNKTDESVVKERDKVWPII